MLGLAGLILHAIARRFQEHDRQLQQLPQEVLNGSTATIDAAPHDLKIAASGMRDRPSWGAT